MSKLFPSFGEKDAEGNIKPVEVYQIINAARTKCYEYKIKKKEEESLRQAEQDSKGGVSHQEDDFLKEIDELDEDVLEPNEDNLFTDDTDINRNNIFVKLMNNVLLQKLCTEDYQLSQGEQGKRKKTPLLDYLIVYKLKMWKEFEENSKSIEGLREILKECIEQSK